MVRLIFLIVSLVMPSTAAAFASFILQILGRPFVSHGDTLFRVQTTPLIDGPSWLPLHAKVIIAIPTLIESSSGRLLRTSAQPTFQHQSSPEEFAFDFVPADATNPSTLEALLKLEHVDGMIRIRRCDKTPNDPSKATQLGLDKLVSNSISATTIINQQETSLIASYSIPVLAESNSYLAAACDFCDRYEQKYSQLHLISNNCWSFALDLLQELEQIRVGKEQEDG